MVNIRGMSQHTLLEHSDDDVLGTRTILTSPVVRFFMCNENFHWSIISTRAFRGITCLACTRPFASRWLKRAHTSFDLHLLRRTILSIAASSAAPSARNARPNNDADPPLAANLRDPVSCHRRGPLHCRAAQKWRVGNFTRRSVLHRGIRGFSKILQGRQRDAGHRRIRGLGALRGIDATGGKPASLLYAANRFSGLDQWLFGRSPAVALQDHLSVWTVELLALGYMSYHVYLHWVLIDSLFRTDAWRAGLSEQIFLAFGVGFIGCFTFPAASPARSLSRGVS